jgi:hypothetical protein
VRGKRGKAEVNHKRHRGTEKSKAEKKRFQPSMFCWAPQLPAGLGGGGYMGEVPCIIPGGRALVATAEMHSREQLHIK